MSTLLPRSGAGGLFPEIIPSHLLLLGLLRYYCQYILYKPKKMLSGGACLLLSVCLLLSLNECFYFFEWAMAY